MNKELITFRFFCHIFLLLIVNTALLVSTGYTFYIWFSISILILSVLLFLDRHKFSKIFAIKKKVSLTRNTIYLLAFLVSYPNHYQYFRDLNYPIVFFFQILNIILFVLVYCIDFASNQKSATTGVDMSHDG